MKERTENRQTSDKTGGLDRTTFELYYCASYGRCVLPQALWFIQVQVIIVIQVWNFTTGYWQVNDGSSRKFIKV